MFQYLFFWALVLINSVSLLSAIIFQSHVVEEPAPAFEEVIPYE